MNCVEIGNLNIPPSLSGELIVKKDSTVVKVLPFGVAKSDSKTKLIGKASVLASSTFQYDSGITFRYAPISYILTTYNNIIFKIVVYK